MAQASPEAARRDFGAMSVSSGVGVISAAGSGLSPAPGGGASAEGWTEPVGDPAAAAAALSWTMRPSRRSVIGAVGRRLMPYLVEATLIPTGLFYLLLATTELRWALVGALCLSYAAVVRRLLAGRPIPGLLVLATLGISARTTVYLFSHSSFIYFVQPILRTVLTAAVFAGSVALGRPLIARFAEDFCLLGSGVRCRPGVVRLFRRLSLLWAGINATAAACTLALLLTLPVSIFVVTAAVTAWIVTFTGVVVTVVASVTTARREGLVTALASNGTLYAATVHPTTN